MGTETSRPALPEPKLRPIFRLEARTAQTFASEMGGTVRLESVSSGTFSGEAATGVVIDGGITRIEQCPSFSRVEGKYNLKTGDGAVIYAAVDGCLTAGEGILHLTLTAAAKKYAWLNDLIAMASARYSADEGFCLAAFALE